MATPVVALTTCPDAIGTHRLLARVLFLRIASKAKLK